MNEFDNKNIFATARVNQGLEPAAGKIQCQKNQALES